MTTVYSWANPPESKTSVAGSKTKPIYTVRLTPEGRKELVKTGETNVYEAIQAEYEQTKIENILNRAQYDPSVLQKTVGTYADVSNMPTTLAAAQQMVIAGEREFAGLPVEIREKFENNPGIYFAQYGTQEWADKLGLKEETENPKEEVKPSES